MLKWTQWTSGMTSSRIGEMWFLFWSFQNCFAPKLWLSSVESEPCVRPFPLRLSRQQPACLCAIMSPVRPVLGGELWMCLEVREGRAAPLLLAQGCLIGSDTPTSQPCYAPYASLHQVWGSLPPLKQLLVVHRQILATRIRGRSRAREAMSCFMQSAGPKDCDPYNSSSCHWTLFPLVLQLFKDSLLILFVFQTFSLFILRQFFSIKK